ncbi:hypothetical protein FS837_000935 [Tulasnella sp. UAMH 9824]|nr:hypothetical protein FS837_000935 [Tulasnella sp. UAMH 9824]
MPTMGFSLTLTLSLWFILGRITGLSNAAPEPETAAVCEGSFGWMNNSRSQSPCLVAAYLAGACRNWYIPALQPGNWYDGPNENQTNLCLCSSVVYNAVSACAACQGDSWIGWPDWKLECDPTLVTVADYKFDIPPGTAIPRWMYQDPTQQIGVSFDTSLAYSVAGQNLPDMTSLNQGIPSVTTSAGTPTPTASSDSGNSVNIGAIVGGVVGGLGFLTAGVFLGWWFLRRRHGIRSSQAPLKQPTFKWSEEVPTGQAPSRWGGTSYGSDGVMDDPAKDRDMMSPTSTLPASNPYAPDGHKPPYDDQRRNRSLESTRPQRPVTDYPSSSPSPYPAERSHIQG